MELGGYVAILRRWWWTLLVATWIAGLVGYLLASSLPPSYEGRARLLVGPVAADLNTLRSAAGLVPTFAELAVSHPVLEAVIESLELEMRPAALAEALSITANDTTRVMTIRYDDTDQMLVAAVPNAVAEELIALQPTGSVLPEGEITVIEEATVPEEPAAPDVPLLVVLAAVAGMVGALMLVLGLEYTNRTIRDVNEVDTLTGLPVLGVLRPPSARSRRGSTSPLFVESMPTSRATAAMRIAAIKATSGRSGEGVKTLLVLGIDTEPGAGQVAVNLAAAVAQTGQRVTVLDANEHSGEATALMAAIDLPGLTDLMSDTETTLSGSEVDDVILPRWSDIRIVPHGNSPARTPNPMRVAQLLTVLAESNDLTIVTGAPVHLSGSALVWSQACDATILVARRDRTKRDALVEAVDSLRLVRAKPTGVILYEQPSNLVVPTGPSAPAPSAVHRSQAVVDTEALAARMSVRSPVAETAAAKGVAREPSSRQRRRGTDSASQGRDGRQG